MIQDAFLLPFLNLNRISQKFIQSWTFTEQPENWHLIFPLSQCAQCVLYLMLNIVCILHSAPTCHASVVTRRDLGAESRASINLVTRRGMILP